MKICRYAGLPAVPFAIAGSYAVSPRNSVRVHPGPVRLTFAMPITAAKVAATSDDELHHRVRGVIAELPAGPRKPCYAKRRS